MVVMLVSIVLFSVIKFDSLLFNILVRIALMPVVAGISYEIIRLSAKKESGCVLQTDHAARASGCKTSRPKSRTTSSWKSRIEALKETLKLEPKPSEPELAPLS